MLKQQLHTKCFTSADSSVLGASSQRERPGARPLRDFSQFRHQVIEGSGTTLLFSRQNTHLLIDIGHVPPLAVLRNLRLVTLEIVNLCNEVPLNLRRALPRNRDHKLFTDTSIDCSCGPILNSPKMSSDTCGIFFDFLVI